VVLIRLEYLTSIQSWLLPSEAFQYINCPQSVSLADGKGLRGLKQAKEAVGISVFQMAMHIASQMSASDCTVHSPELSADVASFFGRTFCYIAPQFASPGKASHLGFIESQNHRMLWVGRDLVRSSSQTPLQRAGTSSTRPSCSEPRPTWPWMFPGMGPPLPLWATCASVSPPFL